jgi:hypothetical protein
MTYGTVHVVGLCDIPPYKVFTTLGCLADVSRDVAHTIVTPGGVHDED